MKPKCPKCGQSEGLVLSAVSKLNVICLRCGWIRRVSSAAIIRLAVEPTKPETCTWVAVGRMGFLDHYTTGCSKQRGRIEGNYCSGCGKPVEVNK